MREALRLNKARAIAQGDHGMRGLGHGPDVLRDPRRVRGKTNETVVNGPVSLVPAQTAAV